MVPCKGFTFSMVNFSGGMISERVERQVHATLKVFSATGKTTKIQS